MDVDGGSKEESKDAEAKDVPKSQEEIDALTLEGDNLSRFVLILVTIGLLTNFIIEEIEAFRHS